MDAIAQVDNAVLQFVNQFARHSETFDRLTAAVANSELLKGALFLAFFWYQWFKQDRDISERRTNIIVLLSSALIAVIVARLVERVVPFHVRPLHALEREFVIPYGVGPKTLAGWSSFPSDHAVLFVALSVAIWRLNRWFGLAALIWTLLLICLPRIYVGYHYLSDIVAGAVLGLALMLALPPMVARLGVARPLLRWERAHAVSFYALAFLASFEMAVMFRDLREFAFDAVHATHLDDADASTPFPTGAASSNR